MTREATKRTAKKAQRSTAKAPFRQKSSAVAEAKAGKGTARPKAAAIAPSKAGKATRAKATRAVNATKPKAALVSAGKAKRSPAKASKTTGRSSKPAAASGTTKKVAKKAGTVRATKVETATKSKAGLKAAATKAAGKKDSKASGALKKKVAGAAAASKQKRAAPVPSVKAGKANAKQETRADQQVVKRIKDANQPVSAEGAARQQPTSVSSASQVSAQQESAPQTLRAGLRVVKRRRPEETASSGSAETPPAAQSGAPSAGVADASADRVDTATASANLEDAASNMEPRRRLGSVIVRRRVIVQQPEPAQKKAGPQHLPSVSKVPVAIDSGLALRRAEQQLGLTLDQPQRRIAKAILAGRDVLVTGRNDDTLRNAWLIAAVAAPKVVLLTSGDLAELAACHEFLRLHGVVSCLIEPGQEGLPAEDCQVILGQPAVLVELGRVATAEGKQILASRILVLQAHRLSSESPDYSSAYGCLRELLEKMHAPPIAVSVQPSVASVREETLRRLGLRNPSQFVLGSTWENLHVEIVPARGEVKERMVEAVLRQLERPIVMFCATPEDVEDVYEMLDKSGEDIFRYHQDMPPGQRAAEQLQFLLSDDSILIATSAFDKITQEECRALAATTVGAEDVPAAFGFNIKKGNIRSVVHFQAPLSLEQYAQEIELAGRDGAPAKAVLFFDPADRELSEARLEDARLEAFQLSSFANHVIAASENGDFSWEDLTSVSNLEEMALRQFTQIALETGAISRSGARFRRVVSAGAMPTVLREVGRKFSQQQQADRDRLTVMTAFARQRTCIIRSLRGNFGMGPKADCGTCGHCNPRAWLGVSGVDSAPTSPRQDSKRGPIETDVDQLGASQIGSYHSGRRGQPRRADGP